MEQVNNNNIEEKLSTLNSQLSTNIYPIFDRMMTREDKERLLKQRSVMVWFTGLSGSGKSTVGIAQVRFAVPHPGRRQYPQRDQQQSRLFG